MLVDLQLHSTYSDGYLTPTDLAQFIKNKEIKIASLTDHNTVGGIAEFKLACKKYNIKPIVGLELYVKLNEKKMNLLWFNFNEKDPDLHKMLRGSQIRRRKKIRKILVKLKNIGFKIEINKILDKYNHYIPLNHIVDDFLDDPYNKKRIRKELKNKNFREGEVIKEYFYNKKIGRLNESYININRVLKLRKKIGGQIILNHPGKNNHLQKSFLERLKKIGIDGVEVLSPHHSYGSVMYAQAMARELDFIETGGSDFHRFEGEGYSLQSSWQYFKIEDKYLRKIKKIIG